MGAGGGVRRARPRGHGAEQGGLRLLGPLPPRSWGVGGRHPLTPETQPPEPEVGGLPFHPHLHGGGSGVTRSLRTWRTTGWSGSVALADWLRGVSGDEAKAWRQVRAAWGASPCREGFRIQLGIVLP